jgi:hypothetical protein
MASLTGQTIAATYKRLLTIDSENFAADASAKYIKDGDAGTASALSLSTTRVGIGTATPGANLEIASASTNAPILRFNRAGDNAITVDDQLGRLQFYGLDSASAPGAYIEVDADGAWDTTTAIHTAPTRICFHTQDISASDTLGTARMTIKSDGKVGIGTTTPVYQFEVANATGAKMALSHGYVGADEVVADGEDLGTIYFLGYDASYSPTTEQTGAMIRAEAAGAWDADNANDAPGELQFFTQSDGTGTGLAAPRMTINSDGKVGIGVTDPDHPLEIKAGTLNQGIKITNSSGVDRFIAQVDGDQSAGEIFMYSGGDAASVVIKADGDTTFTGGDVGIGTTSPDSLLHLESSTSDKPQITIRGSSTTADDQGGGIKFQRTDPDANLTDDDVIGDILFEGRDNSDGAYVDAALIRCQINGTPGTNDMPAELQFHTNAGGDDSVQRMCILANGNVGIGDTSPDAQLHISSGASGDCTVIIEADTDNSGDENDIPKLILKADGGNGHAIFGKNGEPATEYTGALANALYLQSYDNATAESSIQFVTGGDKDAVTPGLARMTIDENGNVGIGSTTPVSALNVVTPLGTSAADATVLHLQHTSNTTGNCLGINVDFSAASPDDNTQYFLYCQDSTESKFVIYSDGDAQSRDNSYGGISDEILKTDIKDANSQWDDIKALKVRNFKFKTDIEAYGDNANPLIGVIAQEAELVSPKLVYVYTKEDGSTNKGFRYSILYMKAVKALQEAMVRIESLEAKDAEYATTITALTARITALESA